MTSVPQASAGTVAPDSEQGDVNPARRGLAVDPVVHQQLWHVTVLMNNIMNDPSIWLRLCSRLMLACDAHVRALNVDDPVVIVAT